MRTIILGGPSRGKSTLAEAYKAKGVPVYCGDPRSQVERQLKGPAREDYTKAGTIYLPEGLPFAGDGGAADWIARNWLMMPGPWVLEGHALARALARWLDQHRHGSPADEIIVLDCPAHRPTTPGQDAMHRGVMTQWAKIAHRFPPGVVQYRRDRQPLLKELQQLKERP